MNTPVKSRKIPFTEWVKLLVVFLLVCFLMGGLVLAVLQARNAALRTQSANNLKQIGLSIYNYHDVFRRLPPGGTLSPKGQPHHGWATFILPFMEASPLYSHIDQELAWNDPLNQHVFRFPYRPYQNPLAPIEFDSQGYAISHYALNQKLFSLNRSLKWDELNEDQSHTWMGQELFDDWHPWGSATNIRTLNWPTRNYNRKTAWQDGGLQLLMADGSVTYFNGSTDKARIDKLRSSQPGLNSSPVLLSDVQFELQEPQWKTDHYELPPRGDAYSFLRTVKNEQGRAEFVYLTSRKNYRFSKADQYVDSTLSELQIVIDREPGTRSLKVQIPLDASVAESLGQLRDLRFLEIGKLELTEDRMVMLKALPKLEMLACRCTETQKGQLQEVLPDVEVRALSLDFQAYVLD